MRKFLAIVVCKLGRFVGKLIGKGSSMPGKFALAASWASSSARAALCPASSP